MNPNADVFVPGRPWACDDAQHDVINTLSALEDLVKRIQNERLLCLDLEGCDLSKGSWRCGELIQDPAVPLHGQICLLQIATPAGEVFLVDVCELGPDTFTSGLKALLENAEVIKVVHDFRQDEDALWHQYGVRVKGLFDCQVADVIIRRLQGYRTTFVQGSAKLFGAYEIEMGYVPGYGTLTQDQKLLIHERFSQDRHLWARRPFPQDMILYAKADVAPLPQLYTRQLAVLIDLLDNNEWLALELVRTCSRFYNSIYRRVDLCRCRLCCRASDNARFDGFKVFARLQESGSVGTAIIQRLWRPEDAMPLPAPGPSKFYVNEYDESVPIEPA